MQHARRTRGSPWEGLRSAPQQAPALDRLPDQESRQTEGDVSRPFQQGERQGQIRGHTHRRTENDVSSLLHPDRIGHDEGSGTHRIDEALDRHDRGEGQRLAG